MYGWHSFGAGSRQQSGHHSQVKGARRRAGRQCMHIHPTDEVTPLASRETDGRAEDRLVQHGGGGKKRLSVNYSCRRPAAPALVGHIPTLAKCALQVFRLYSTRHHATYVLGMREAMFVYVQLHCRMIRAIHCHSETAPQRGQWKIECDVAADRLAAQEGRRAGGRADANSDDIKLAPSDVWRLCSIARGRGGVCGRSFIVFAITKDTLHTLATAQYAVERTQR